VIPATPQLPATEIEALEDTADEVDEVAEALAAHDIISEERHDEIIERVEACQNQLAVLSTQERAENPVLSEIRTELSRLLAEVTALSKAQTDLRLSMDTRMPSIPQPSRLEPESTVEPEPPNQAESTDAPAPAEATPQPVPAKRRRFTKI
jgi:hypothetical protein